MKPKVVLPRPLHLGDQGLDVIATKRALSRAGYIQWPGKGKAFTPVYGPYMQQAVEELARRTGHDAKQGYTKTLHEALRGTHAKGRAQEWAFDQLAIHLEAQEVELLSVTPEQRIRRAIVSAGWYWYAHRASIAYSQARPFQMGKPPWVPTRWDCSAFVTVCHYAGGATNPNQRPWDGEGYTGTLMSGGQRCGLVDLEIGDLIFYGYTTSPSPAFPVGSPTHVALFVGYENHTPMVLSMGGYPMSYMPVTYRGVNCYRHYNVI